MPVHRRYVSAVADLILSILVTAVVAAVVAVFAVLLVGLGVQRAREARSGKGLRRPHRRNARLGFPGADNVRAVGGAQNAALAASVKSEPTLTEARPLVVARHKLPAEDGRRRGEAGPWAASTTLPVQQMLPGSAASEPGGASSTERYSLEPASPVPKSPKAVKRRRRRSTIAVDPLDAPRDARHARVAIGARIDDLEVGKIRRME